MKTITITTEEYDKLKADVKAAEIAMTRISGLSKSADDCRGMVDHPYDKALRAASILADDFLKGIK
jgi:hypothetical protein